MLNFRGPLIEDLVARGHVVYAIAPEIDTEIDQALRHIGAEPVPISLSRTGTNPFTDLASIRALHATLKTLRPDITLGCAAKPAIYGTLAAWLAGVSTRFAMIEGLGYVFVSGPNESVAKRTLRGVVMALFRLALAGAEKVIFLNPDDIADFTAMGLIQPAQAINIGGIGVDLSLWCFVPVVTAPVTFTFVGRLLRDKGVLDFIAAARAIKSCHAETRFLLVGGLDDNPESIQRHDVEAWVEEGIVEWPGHVPVQPWLEQTSVFVLPSYYREGVPRSTQEAMAMGRSIITTDVPGCRETVIDGLNGYLIPPRNPTFLATAMERFITNPELIEQMGKESRILAEKRFDVRQINAVMIATMGL